MTHPREQIFTNATAAQAREYQDARGHPYPPAIYKHILARHKATGGQTSLVLDLGCGPGNATRDLVQYFDRVVGLDGSAEMINTARAMIPADLKNRLSFQQIPAERTGQVAGVEPNSVDVITAATAAHWFNLSAFYTTALSVLKPGGTIALWVRGRPRVASDQPFANELNAIIEDLHVALLPYRQPSATTGLREERGEINGGSAYEFLPLPWTCEPPVLGYDEASFERRILCNENGAQSFPQQSMSIAQAERAYGSGSPIIKWRQQHPDLANTDQDVVRLRFDKIRKLLDVHNATLQIDMTVSILTWSKAA